MSDSEQPAQSMRESVGRFLTIIGGVGLIFKGFVWILARFGFAQTASALIQPRSLIMRVAAFGFEYWPVWVFALGIFMLACIHYGHPRSWVAKIWTGKSPVEAEEKRARFKVSYDDKSLECRFPTQYGDGAGGAVARLRVESDRQSGISGCYAELEVLEKDGEIVMSGPNLLLGFAPGDREDATNKTINYGSAEHLEVLWIPDAGTSKLLTRFPFAFANFEHLNWESRYSFHIALLGHEAEAEMVILDAQVTDNAWRLSLRQPS